MLLNLHKKNWTEGLRLQDWENMKTSNEESIKVCLNLLLSVLSDEPPTEIVSNLPRKCWRFRKITLPQSRRRLL